MSRCQAIYFLQKPFNANTEQLGCYYFNVLEAVEQCINYKVSIVPPRLPLCPRDNTKVELNSMNPWDSSIRTIGSVDSSEVLDYSKISILTLREFYYNSNGKVRMKGQTLDISGLIFNSEATSEYWILDLPSRWDLQGKDHNIFYNILYPTLPLKNTVLEGRIPDWYIDKSKIPFLGVHWRRGDRGNTTLGSIGKYLWKSTDPINVAACINKYLVINPELEWVYVSTNSGSDSDRKKLCELVNKPLYYFKIPRVLPLEQWKWDIADLLLCAKAKHLILSPGSLQNSSAFGRLMYAECLQQNPTDAIVSFIPLIY
jgi:hypothetical protein